MPKKILFESAVHQLASAGKRRCELLYKTDPLAAEQMKAFLHSWRISPGSGRKLIIEWTDPSPGSSEIDYNGAAFYTRGDDESTRQKQLEAGLAFAPDSVQNENERHFDALLTQLVNKAGLSL